MEPAEEHRRAFSRRGLRESRRSAVDRDVGNGPNRAVPSGPRSAQDRGERRTDRIIHRPYYRGTAEGGVEIGDRTQLEWYRFGDFSGALLYEAMRFRQAIFVVEQASPYPDLDSLDQRAHHLLLWVDEALTGCLRLLPDPGEARIRVGRVAVAASLRRQGLARRLMDAAL